MLTNGFVICHELLAKAIHNFIFKGFFFYYLQHFLPHVNYYAECCSSIIKHFFDSGNLIYFVL